MKRILLVLAFATLSGLGQAQELSRVGTSAAQFLKFGAGARAAAMGESFAALSGDVACLYWNPAGAAAVVRRSVQLSYLDLYLGLNFGFIGFVEPLGAFGALGVHASYLHSGDIEITTLEEPNGTGRFYSARSLAVGLTFARALTDRLSLGVTAKYVQEGIYNEVAHTLAFDGGMLFATGLFGTTLGVGVSNLGGKLQVQGEDLWLEDNRFQRRTEEWPLPMAVRLGLSCELIGSSGQLLVNETNRLLAAFTIVDSNDAFIRATGGMEYVWRDVLALRGGLLQGDGKPRLALGAGLKSGVGPWTLSFDYALVSHHDLGAANHVTVGVQF